MEMLMVHIKCVHADKLGDEDPFAKWWEMKLDSQADGPWYWGSSDEFPPALIRDVVQAPRCASLSRTLPSHPLHGSETRKISGQRIMNREGVCTGVPVGSRCHPRPGAICSPPAAEP